MIKIDTYWRKFDVETKTDVPKTVPRFHQIQYGGGRHFEI